MSEFDLSPQEIEQKIGTSAYQVWRELEAWLAETYDMERIWGKGYKKWARELRYRKGGKTLCGFYVAEGFFGFMVIFGKAERAKADEQRDSFTPEALQLYDAATNYHDGKWVMLEMHDSSLLEDAKRMVLIKRKPNNKH